MKRFLVIPLMFLYLLAITGVMVNAHYCGKQLVSWNVYLKASDCGNCGDDKGKIKMPKCCKDKVITAKVAQDQNSASFKLQLSDTQFIPAHAPQVHYYTGEVVYTSAVTPANRANAPPGLWQQIPLYQLHSSLTYYG